MEALNIVSQSLEYIHNATKMLPSTHSIVSKIFRSAEMKVFDYSDTSTRACHAFHIHEVSNNACSRQLKMFWWKNHDDVDTKCLHTFVFIFISWQQNSFQSGPSDKRLWSSGLHNTGLSRTHKSSKFWVFCIHRIRHSAFSRWSAGWLCLEA